MENDRHMTGAEIVSYIASQLTPPEIEMARGRNSSLLNEYIDSNLNPFRKEWVRSFFLRCKDFHEAPIEYKRVCETIQGVMKECYCIYSQKVSSEVLSYDVFLFREDVSTFQLTVREHEGYAAVSILYDGVEYPLSLSEDMLKELLMNIRNLPFACDREIVREHLYECFQNDLKYDFKEAKLESRHFHSGWSDGSYYYNHEVRFKFDDRSDFVLAYTPRVNDREEMEKCFENASWAKFLLGKIKDAVEDNLVVVCIHWDDFGVSLSEKPQVRNIELGSAERDQALFNIKDATGARLHGWFVSNEGSFARIYVTGRPEWNREVYIDIPWDCRHRTLKRIGQMADTWKELSEMWEDDCNTTVALVPRVDAK